MPWLAATEEELLDLLTGNFTHFDNVVRVDGGTVRMLRRADDIAFVSAKTASPAYEPWLAV